MDNYTLELLIIIEKQQKEIEKLQDTLDRIRGYIKVYEELIRGDK